jgi:general secretion pathway protein G
MPVSGFKNPMARARRAASGRKYAYSGPSSGRGLTILELMLVITILGVLTTIAYASYQNYRYQVQVAQAVIDIEGIQPLISQYELDNGDLPDSLNAIITAGSMLDPWGTPYQYINHSVKGTRGIWRRDKNIVPLNTDYDLFSMGKDRQSRPPLPAKVSRDDIVRANDGRFVGLASDYDP